MWFKSLLKMAYEVWPKNQMFEKIKETFKSHNFSTYDEIPGKNIYLTDAQENWMIFVQIKSSTDNMPVEQRFETLVAVSRASSGDHNNERLEHNTDNYQMMPNDIVQTAFRLIEGFNNEGNPVPNSPGII